jgi:membrane fusion protein (multidrug efflux system)
MIKKFALAFTGFLVVVGLLTAIKAAQIKEMSSVVRTTPPIAVTSAKAQTAVWNPLQRSIGTLAPIEGVTLAPDADGTVTRILAENGATVQEGDLILELDASVEQAQLAAAEAQQKWTELEFRRATDLVAKNSAPRNQLDTAEAQLAQASAAVNQIKAQIEKKRLRAPFSGRIGIRQVNAGQYVSRGRGLIPLQKLDRMYVNFSVPQRQLAALSPGQKVFVRVDAFPAPFTGSISAINSEVDAATRNISVQAILPNPQQQLRSGMFVQVEVELPGGRPQVVVPATAISYASYGNSIFVITKLKDAAGREYLGVQQKLVKLGETRGDLVAIEDGLQAGEEVVTSGVFKLRDHAEVQINNSNLPSASASPRPGNT